MAEKESKFEKFMKISNVISFGVLAFAILTANNVLAMGSAVDFTGNVIMGAEYQKWKKRRKNKK